MATITYRHSSFSDGAVIVEFDRNTANDRMAETRCINNSDQAAAFRVFDSGVQVYPSGGGWALAAAHQTTSWNTSGVRLTVDVEGALNMGTYTVFAGWPA